MKIKMYVTTFSACYPNDVTINFVALSKTSDESVVQDCIDKFGEYDCFGINFFKEEGVFIITQEVYDTMFKDLFNFVKKLKEVDDKIKGKNRENKTKERTREDRIGKILDNSNWVLTDDDCFQWVKPKEPNIFEVLEVECLSPYGEHLSMVRSEIDINEYLDNDFPRIIDILKANGYITSSDNKNEALNIFIQKVGENSWKQLLAEMIFEDTRFTSGVDESEDFDEEEDAKNAILDYIEAHLH